MIPGMETDRYQLILTDRPGDTESHGTDFGARFGDPFTYVTYVPAPDDTEVGNRPPSVRPDPPGDPMERPNHTGPSLRLDSVSSSSRLCTPQERWFAASWGQPVFDTWIRSQWEPGGGGGGALCVIGVPPDATLVWCGFSTPRMDITLLDHSIIR